MFFIQVFAYVMMFTHLMAIRNDNIYGTVWHLYFEYYDWVLAGTYYYKAEGAYGEVSVRINS